ncbi:NAD(P)-binding domain-containing protein [Streptomyces aidingensis]|uniref:Predicted flavoprotein CzcO associated with the cation diffusion facilitator CzcD n=1 Tax=Streptomyces aidingensis TaxID=910347 RepID=A0A1I1QNB3_9ACTN|nr:NAD(P)-binding domain-containing protein [Streptomyces aidingensis]SFD23611.1 Predicted flavoprotein CzcO associated with the cation diffusion facilitator CzcD [Streptomyces aidingensis]
MHDLVVVGAGPYGLSIAAHAAAAGLDLRVFGRPMASWRDHMPEGMFLKSEPWASDLSDPSGGRTLSDFCAPRGLRAEHGHPLPLDTFTDYGLWFAKEIGPRVEECSVSAVTPLPGGAFRVTTGTGEVLYTRTVAMAVGVMPFIRIPEPLRDLPEDLVTHSSRHRDLSRFRGREVTVLGAGQAALETAVLLAENGARARLVARAPALRWNTPPQPLVRSRAAALRAPHSGLGTGWSTWLYAEAPWAVRRLPGRRRARIFESALGPAGAWWLRERFEETIPVSLDRRVVRAVLEGRRLRLELTDARGKARQTVRTGQVIAATGFLPDLRRLEILDPAVRDRLRTVPGTRAPELDGGMESSHPGLFFAGLLAAPAYGPAMRFVHGAGFSAGRLVRGVRRRLTAVGRRAVPVPGQAAAVGGTAGGAAGPALPAPHEEPDRGSRVAGPTE